MIEINTPEVYLPAGAAVVEAAVECEVEGGSVDFPMWRGPGTAINSSVHAEAVDIWRRESRAGRCPTPGAVQDPGAGHVCIRPGRKTWLQEAQLPGEVKGSTCESMLVGNSEICVMSFRKSWVFGAVGRSGVHLVTPYRWD